MTAQFPPVRQRAPLLLSSTQWAQKEAISYLSAIYEENFSALTLEQRKRYPKLFENYQLAMESLDYELSLVRDTFKVTHMAQLKSALKTLLGVDIDPEQARIYTRYRENVEEDLIEFLARMGGEQSAAQDSKFTFSPPRTRRAVDESRFKEHVKSVSLWEAACENFSYRTDSVLLKPFSYEQASYIDYNSDLKGQPAGPFIAIVRQLDLGTRLSAALEQAIGTSGPLTQSTWAVARASLEFDLLEALRNRQHSKIFSREHDKLFLMLKGKTPPHIWPVSMSLTKKNMVIHGPGPRGKNHQLLFGNEDPFNHVWYGEVPIPLFIIKVEDEKGVFSYFPQRLGGALLWHVDAPRALSHFRQQLKTDHGNGQLGWFMRQLALKDIGFFSKLLSKEPRPEGLTWLAGVMYDAFKGVFPEPDLDSLQLYIEVDDRASLPLAQVITKRQLDRYRANLSQLATSKSVRDWQAFKEALSDLGSEVLSLLTTPVPGGVLGLNAIMQAAVFGSLAYSLAQGVSEAIKGEANTFASALADTADLLINARLIGVAAKVHRQRMLTLWNTVGQPRKVTQADGSVGLWHPDLKAYPHLEPGALDNLAPTSEGLYARDGKLYAQFQEGDQTLAIEVIFDTQSQSYVLKTQSPLAFKPSVKFDPARQRWSLVLDDVQALDAKQLLQRMLPGDTPDSALVDIERMLSITGTSREQLLAVWQGGLVPGPLAEGVRRLQADQLIDRINSDLPLRGEMPENADSAVLALLTQLPHWPVDTVLDVFNQQGQLIETWGPDLQPGALERHVELKRLDHGSYVAKDDATQGSAEVEQLFTLILDQLPATSPLGREGNPEISKAGRIASVREQIANLAHEDRPLLFKALTGLEGHKRSDPVASSDPARKYLPLLSAPLSDSTTALLAKLHALNPSLSIECLETLLAAHPFSAAQVTRALEHNAQPLPFAEAADRLKIKLRVDQALDGIYHRRVFNQDSDHWVREFARGALHDTLNRRLVITEADMPAYVHTGPTDTTVALRHHGNGVYGVSSRGDGGMVTFSLTPDSFFLALTWFLGEQERSTLGMESGVGVDGVRKHLGDAMLANRQANGEVSLWDTTTAQYERKVSLPAGHNPSEFGLYEIQGKHYVSLYGAAYQVAFDPTVHKWRMVHPDKPGVNTPVLEHNYKGAWRQQIENPQQWEGLQLLRRLRAEPTTFSDEVGQQILAVSNTDEGVLRQVHMNNLAPPPLLMDTWKRFKIEEDIKGFVHKLQAHHTLSEARSDFQLLLIQSLPGWPRDKVLQIVDAQGTTLKEYGVDLDSALPRIRLSIDATRNGGFLRTLLMNLNEADTRALVGEYSPVIETRMLALAKKIAAHALKREANLFRSVYESLEHSADPHVTLVQKNHPQLPTSVIEQLILHTSGKEREHYLDKGLVPPRVTEQIQWTAKEVRLARAYEGLYLNATATPDSEKLTLHLLQSLPGWPSTLSIEVHRGHVSGEVLDRIGAADAPTPRILVLHEGRYRAWSSEGHALNPESTNDNNLLSSILHVLTPAELAAIKVKDASDTQTLSQKIRALAIAQRASMATLLGLAPPAPPRKPPMNIDSSFIAYPLTVTINNSSHPLSMIREARALYPSLSYEQAISLLDGLGNTQAERQAALAQRRTEFQMLQGQLQAWAQVQLYPSGTSHMGMAAPGHRQQVRERIERAWRREADIALAEDGNEIGYVLNLAGLDVGDLPALSGDFSHVSVLRMEDMNLRSGSNEFLSSFTQLRMLGMSSNRLQSLPSAIADMPHLTALDLTGNRISLTPETAQQLANHSSLEILHLSNNPLGITPDVSQLQNLRSLNLNNTGITEWPNGLWTLTHVEWAGLRNNAITNISPAVFAPDWSAGANRVTTISGNPINDSSRDRIIVYWAHGNSDFGYGPALSHALDLVNHNAQVQVTMNDVSPWLSLDFTADQTSTRT